MTELKKVTRNFREKMPYYNHGRRVIVADETTKKGQSIIDSASHYDGTYLYQVYDKPSEEKQRIFDACFEMYCNDKNASDFSICSHNGFVFTVSWVNDFGVVYLTRDTEYIVLCEDCIERINNFLA